MALFNVFMNESGKLSNENIDNWIELALQRYIKVAGKRATAANKFRFRFDELLVECQECYGSDATVRIIGRKSRDFLTFELTIKGDRINPTEAEYAGFDDGGMSHYASYIERIGLKPTYTYDSKNGLNRISINAQMKPAKNGMVLGILSALAAAVIMFAITGLIAPQVGEVLYESFTKPVFDKIIEIIAGMATPLVFLAVITGITGIGDAGTFGKIGKKVCLSMGFTYLVAGTVFAIGTLIVYPLGSSETTGGAGIISEIVTLVLDMLPGNLFEPFVTGNDLQVISFAIFIGAAMLPIAQKIPSVNNFFAELSTLINRMMMIICKLLPVVVFLGIFNILTSSSLADFVSIYKACILFVVLCAFIIVFTVCQTLVAAKVPLKLLLKKTAATSLINLTTSSQVSALPENMHCCKDKFGIEEKLVDFALPLGVVVFMPCGAILLGNIVTSLSAICGITLSAGALFKVTLSVIILAIAAPPIPGSVFAVLPITFAICGVPESVFPLAVVIGTLLGYFLPLFNGFLIQMRVLFIAIKLDMVDRSKLENPDIE